MRILFTPGIEEATRNFAGLGDKIVEGIRAVGRVCGRQPSWAVLSPDKRDGETDDDGRTVYLTAPARAYVIRDDHPLDCECGCSGGAVVTALLPEEY